MRYLQSPDPFYSIVILVALGGFFLMYFHTHLSVSSFPITPQSLGFVSLPYPAPLPLLLSLLSVLDDYIRLSFSKRKVCYFFFLIFFITSHLSPQSSQLSYLVGLKTLAPSLGICFMLPVSIPLLSIIDNLPLVHLFSSPSVHLLTVQ